MSRHKLLIISYLFPPAGGIAVQRALSMAKYLPDCGFEVHVLTAANAAAPVYDSGLLRQVPRSVIVHHAMTLEVPFALRHRIWSLIGARPGGSEPAAPYVRPRRSFPMKVAQRVFCPEPEVVWVPFAKRAARRIVEQYGIQCVLVTAPPFSAFLVGNALKRTFPSLKFVADFRDEWLTFYINNNEFQNTDFARQRAAEIERETIEASDLVVAVTDSSLKEIKGRYPSQPPAKFRSVSNGFDPEAFADFEPRVHGEDAVIVTHVGTVYKNASPRFYFEALAQLPEPIRMTFRTRFIGRVVDTEHEVLSAQGSSVQVLGFMPQAEALRYMEDTDYLLLTMTDRISMPGKLYEYLATGKPILAISPRGSEVDQMIRNHDIGWCADPTEPGTVVEMLMKALELARRRDGRFRHNRDIARRYERPQLVAHYAALMRQTIEGGSIDCPGSADIETARVAI
jgi:glycosyltransferase involved in cell wall biosynthesis